MTLKSSNDFGKTWEIQKVLNEVQDRLFTVGSHLACDPDKESAIQNGLLLNFDLFFLFLQYLLKFYVF
mgnify:CR=1 FL=1